jgi:hypothetical protein
MPMKNPPHPGGFVLEECIEPLGLTITQAAQALGVTRVGAWGRRPDICNALSLFRRLPH